MKLVLSRKGFDSQAGGCPSPIFPSGDFYSLPIPGGGTKRYEEISLGEHRLGAVVNDLTNGRIKPTCWAHLDPDLYRGSIQRKPYWRPAFGQSGAAESHLRKMGVGEGDLFLFFGWFKRVEFVAGRYRYVRGAPDVHVLFGWLQVEKRICTDSPCNIPGWASDHPHYAWVLVEPLNSLYLSTERLELPGLKLNTPGAGAFTTYRDMLCLTAPGRLRTVWRLRSWFYPKGKSSALSYHGDISRWTSDGHHALLQSVGRGQEFVLDCDEYPEALDWLSEMFSVCD